MYWIVCMCRVVALAPFLLVSLQYFTGIGAGLVFTCTNSKTLFVCLFHAVASFLETSAIQKYPNKVNKNNIDLAEQQLMDCTERENGQTTGCHGGNDDAFVLKQLTEGKLVLHDESYFPYLQKGGWCSNRQPTQPYGCQMQGAYKPDCVWHDADEIQQTVDYWLSRVPYWYVSKNSQVNYLPEKCAQALLSVSLTSLICITSYAYISSY